MNRIRENRHTSLISHTVTPAMMRTVLKSNKTRFIACSVSMLWRKAGVP